MSEVRKGLVTEGLKSAFTRAAINELRYRKLIPAKAVANPNTKFATGIGLGLAAGMALTPIVGNIFGRSEDQYRNGVRKSAFKRD